MSKEFNGFQYILVESNDGFNVLEQRDNFVRMVRATSTEETHNGWVTFIRYPHANSSESLARIALTRIGSIDKSYFTLKEEFKKEDLVDRTSRAAYDPPYSIPTENFETGAVLYSDGDRLIAGEEIEDSFGH